MGTINIVKTVKQVHPSCMVLVKIGTFYDVYSKDAYIISHLVRYKIQNKNNIPTCSFPCTSISKIENILEKNKINYIVLDKRNNYEEIHKSINKQENNYEKIFKQSEKDVTLILEIQKINEWLMNNRNRVKLLDFFVNISYDKKIINQKKYVKVGQRLDDVIKYVIGWLTAITKVNNNGA